VDPSHLGEVDNALLLISEAREFVERTARRIDGEGGDAQLITALEEADRDLLSIHGELMRATYFGSSKEQLKLAG
jgi:hypothetical protein